jgi:thiosulfate reductase cytochrome b subunit
MLERQEAVGWLLMGCWLLVVGCGLLSSHVKRRNNSQMAKIKLVQKNSMSSRPPLAGSSQ